MPYKDPEKKKENDRRYRNRPEIKEKLVKYMKEYGASQERKAINNAAGRAKRAKIKADPVAWALERSRINAYMAEYRKKNETHIRARRAKHYQENKETYSQQNKAWRLAHPERARALKRISESRRKAQRETVGGKHTWKEWDDLVRLTGNKCLRCWRPGNPHSLHRDHIVSLALKGSDNIDNIQPLCRSCNVSKNSRCIDYRLDRWAPMFPPPSSIND